MKSIIRFFILLLVIIILVPIFAQDSQGFFLDDFSKKNAIIPPYQDINQPHSLPTVHITVNFNDTIAKVSKYIYGNNANIYMTQMVTEPKLII